jgi:hypothetical protein
MNKKLALKILITATFPIWAWPALIVFTFGCVWEAVSESVDKYVK